MAWVGKKGGPEWLGILLATLILVTLIVGCLAVILPIISQQTLMLNETLPRLRETILDRLPVKGAVRQALETGIGPGTVADSRLLLQRLFVFAEMTLSGLVTIVVVAALAVYLLVEGRQSFACVLGFFPVHQREKLSLTFRQVSRLVSAYVAGQCLVSAWCAAYLFVVLTILGVPMPLLLGVVAGTRAWFWRQSCGSMRSVA